MKKIADWPTGEEPGSWFLPACNHREHNPPNMIVLPPGIYEHTCPGCGRTVIVRIPPKPTLTSHRGWNPGP